MYFKVKTVAIWLPFYFFIIYNKYVSDYIVSILSDPEAMRQIAQLRIDDNTGNIIGIPIGKP